MKVKKRLCCLVLVVCLTISLFPVNAFATSGISSQYSDEEIEEIMSQCPYTVTGGSYGESYVYDVTSQKLTLYSGTLSVSGTPNKSDPAYIEVAPNSVLELTICDVSPVSDVNGSNGGPGLKIGANATVNLVLAGENMFCRGWDDIHDYSVYLDSGAKVTVSGNGSLICNKNYGYPKLYLSDTAELIIKSGSVQFKGGQNSNSDRKPHTVGGSGKLVVDGGTVLIADVQRGKVFRNNPSIELKNGELQFEYDGEFGNCRLEMEGGILKLRQDKEFTFNGLQYNGGAFEVAKTIRFNGQTAINASFTIPENATFIIPAGQTMKFATGTDLTVSSGGTLQNEGVIQYYCQDTSIPAAANGNTEAYHIYDQKAVNDKYLKTPATCINVAVYYMSCVCGEKGTETFENGDALGHSWGSWQSNRDNTHTRTCQICAVEETGNCTGGTATCVNKAICSVCNAEHGAVDPTNHTGTEAWITTDTTHTKVWSCCQAVIKAEEEHNWENGTCTICQYPCHHTGGTATCSQLAQCELCGSLYGDLDPDNHLAESEWIQENGKHYHRCTYGCDAHLDEAECSGGTATCTAQALCAVCGGTYGAVDPANHANLVKTEAKAATHLTEGNIEYWHCDGCDKYFRDQAATEEIADLSEIVIPKLAEHTPDNTGWHSDDNNHWNTCACGAKLNEAAHTFEWVIDKQPTETEAGSKHEECTVCGYAKAAVEIPATGTTTPSTSPAPTSSPDATTTPAPTASPDATTTPAPTGTSGATATPAPTAEPETGTGPKTGDSTNAAPWAALLLAAGAALTGTALYSRKRKQNG